MPDFWVLDPTIKSYRRRQCRVAGGGLFVALTAWPRQMARLQSSTGELLSPVESGLSVECGVYHAGVVYIISNNPTVDSTKATAIMRL